MKRVHAFVSGRVQGVFYRASTATEAKRLGIAGWVRNLPDGRVEFVAEGPADAVDALLLWSRKGPAYSRVDSVNVKEEDYNGEYDEFSIRY